MFLKQRFATEMPNSTTSGLKQFPPFPKKEMTPILYREWISEYLPKFMTVIFLHHPNISSLLPDVGPTISHAGCASGLFIPWEEVKPDWTRRCWATLNQKKTRQCQKVQRGIEVASCRWHKGCWWWWWSRWWQWGWLENDNDRNDT